jgi:dsDNA-specific endonuclease/ATPase MutS2
MPYSYEERRNIFEHIKVLVDSEQQEIFRIIRKTKENYTENSNGIFFDLATISESAFVQINEYLNFCLKTRQEDILRLNELETIRIQNENYIDIDNNNSSMV